MPSGRDDESGRFADARERDEPRRQAGRGAPGRPDQDLPQFDLADLDLAAALREAARTVPGPDHETSARMRAGVMEAITGAASPEREADGARVLGERAHGARRPGSAGSRGAGRAGRSSRPVSTRPGDERPSDARGLARRGRSRLMANALAGFCAVMILGALTVVISRGALPGQMLYGVKTASESVEMGLTSGPEARGQKNLEFAGHRLDEISGLIERDSAMAAGAGPVAAGLDPSTASLVARNLLTFDQQARDGSKLLLPLIGRSGGPPPAELADWARSQSTRLGSLSPSLPASQQASVADSRRLMDRLGARAAAVDERKACPQGSSASSDEDEFGPVPATCGGTDRTSTSSSPSLATSTTGKRTPPTRTTTEDPTSSSSEDSSRTTADSTSSSAQQRSSSHAPLLPLPVPSVNSSQAPVNVPLPVPGLPPVTVPPLVPGLPGLSLG